MTLSFGYSADIGAEDTGDNDMKSILIIADYFGIWPPWIGVYFMSCAKNPTINWLIHTDCGDHPLVPSNVKLVHMSRREYTSRVSDTLDVKFEPESMYAICNVRPMFGRIFSEEISEYDYYGWGDIDVVYGDIRSFYNDDILKRNVISTDSHICSGHLLLIRNEEWLRDAYKLIPDWMQRLEDPGPCDWRDSLDEARLSGIFSPVEEARMELAHPNATPAPHKYWEYNYFCDQRVTPFVPGAWIDGNVEHPERWFWRNGIVTNERDRERSFIYLHFMNFRAKRYIDPQVYQSSKTWDEFGLSVEVDFGAVDRGVIEISRSGFKLILDA